MTHSKRLINENLHETENETRSKSLLSLYKGLFSAFFMLSILLLPSCSNDTSRTNSKNAAVNANTTEQDVTIEKLLKIYDEQDRRGQYATADMIFDLLYREEMTDTRITVSNSTPSDSINMLVWYWAGEHLWATQDYAEGLRYSEKALPLTYELGDLSLQSLLRAACRTILFPSVRLSESH